MNMAKLKQYSNEINMYKKIKINGKKFALLISKDEIQDKIKQLATQITKDYAGKQPLFVGIMNGCFMFAADLFRQIGTPAEITFIKLLSYKGTSSSESVVHSIGLEHVIKDRHVIILEDIVDTGKTLNSFLPELKAQAPASIRIASCLFKPKALKHNVIPDYYGFDIENDFVVGYGLDYDGIGRNTQDIYVLTDEEIEDTKEVFEEIYPII